MIVADIMSKEPITISKKATVLDAAKIMMEKKISILPVVDTEGTLQGVITQSDFVGKEVDIPHALVSIKELLGKSFHNRDIEEIYRESKDTPVEQVMTKKIFTVKPNDDMNSVVSLMIKHGLKRIPVVKREKGKVEGIITRRNLLKAFIKT